MQTRSFATGRAILALMLREMSTRYGRTPGGYVWAVIEPLGAILMISLGFSLMLRSPALGSSFILFYASGYLPFSLYSSIAGQTAQALNFSKPLLAYPSVTWLDALLARFFLNTLTNAVIAYLLLGGILELIETKTVLDTQLIVLAMALASLLGLGIGTLNCVLIGLFPTWGMIWSIATRPLFLASGVIFTYESLPITAQQILWYNPLLQIIGLLRAGLYPMYHAEYVSVGYVLVCALIPLVLGLLLLRHHYKDILNR